MSTYSAFATESSLETNGITLDFGNAGKVRIARAGGANKKFEKAMMRLTKPYRHAINSGTIDPKTADQLLYRAYAEAVVIGWEGITGKDGADLPFSADAAVALFTDLPDFFQQIRRNADSSALFRVETNEDDSKNS